MNLTFWCMSPSCLPFPLRLIMSHFSFILIVFCQFFTWIALVNVDLFFRLILVTKADAVVGGTISAACLYYQCNQSIHVTDVVTVTSLSASLRHKKSVARGLLSQTVLNRKLLYEFKNWCKFSSRVTAKSCKKKLCKKRPACT